jgi:outer membrane immunogenic protein
MHPNVDIGVAMKRLVLAHLAMMMCLGVARAEDLPAQWTGFYVGLNAAYGQGVGQDAVTPLPYGPAPAFDVLAFTYDQKLKGWLGGAQLGYNWQHGPLVLGFETDIDKGKISGDGIVAPLTDLSTLFPISDSFETGHQEIKWLGTVRGRIGAAAGPLMLYGTGGLAYGRVELSELNVVFPGFLPLTFAGSQSSWRTGWVAGTGAEWAFAQHWSAKAEFLHFDLGSTTLFAAPLAPNPPLVVQSVVKTTGNLFRLGVNFRFN